MPLSFRRASHVTGFRAHHAQPRAHLFVSVTDGAGHSGLGESVPHDISCAGVFLDTHASALARLDTPGALRDWTLVNAAAIDAAPGAFCAAELALLDLFARRDGVSVEQSLAIKPPAVPPRVTALYCDTPYIAFQLEALRFRSGGMRSSRLTLLGDRSRDARRARRLGPRDNVRLHAHNLWRDAPAAISGLMEARDHAWAVEEPLTRWDWRGMEQVRRATGLAIIAGDSLGTRADLDAMPEGRDFIPSLRVSKQGGLLRALDLVARAREQGRAIIVGAEPGESSILARAGLVLACAANGALITTEVGYASRTLSADATTPSLRFSRDGVLEMPAFETRPGWGLDPAPALAAALTRTPSAA
jgi:L-alanine-DL-glutamate epimerase-like enolase superfamily enzyme